MSKLILIQYSFCVEQNVEQIVQLNATICNQEARRYAETALFRGGSHLLREAGAGG